VLTTVVCVCVCVCVVSFECLFSCELLVASILVAHQQQPAQQHLRPIGTSNVKSIKPLSLSPSGAYNNGCHPVFLFTFTNGDKVVLKQEMKGSRTKEEAAFSAKFGVDLMRSAASGVVSSHLSKDEMMAIQMLPATVSAPFWVFSFSKKTSVHISTYRSMSPISRRVSQRSAVTSTCTTS
jgi:hypothetical protein